jgi:prepilin-type N-terminal cleavage/methylation domain-containing protein
MQNPAPDITFHAIPITFHVSRFTPHVSRITHHASRFPLHAPRSTLHAPRPARAFTLIELLIVISVIALLAALTFPAVRGAKLSVMRARARSEMTQVETAIERYKDKLGYYPPDNATNWAMNQLYYELLGTTNIGTAAAPIYSTLDGSSQIKASDFGTAFGTTVTGFMNCSRASRGDEPSGAMSFLKGLKPGQCMVLTNPSGPICTILVCALDGPPALGSPGSDKINPWRYNSSSPYYNTKSFDLWIDVIAGNKTNRICNWSDKPITVYYTSIATSYPLPHP